MQNGIVWDIRPEVFSFLPLPRWYSLLFAAGIVFGYLIFRNILKREGKPLEMLDSLLMHIVLGMMIGMRLGHCFFYQPDYYLAHPLEIPMIWKGGYASHGGFAGVLIALALFVRKHKDATFLWLADRVTIIAMLAAGFIRVGNFFNSEMIGHPTDAPWAVVFAQIDQVPRHPAQLYEAVGYFAVSGITWLLYVKGDAVKVRGRLLGVGMVLGFAWRFFCEFFKEDQVPFEQGMTLNMGQLLSLPFILLGAALIAGVFDRRKDA
jgi:prolipoprotein diacylglyceryl transferase